jgi:hypothetical protein
LVAFEVSAQVQQWFHQQLPVLEQCRNQQSTCATVAVLEKLNGFGLRMDRGDNDQRRQRRRRVNKTYMKEIFNAAARSAARARLAFGWY